MSKLGNEYMREVSAYSDIPKSVFAAIAVSYALRQVEDRFEKVEAELMCEWRALHAAGIVPQAPPKRKEAAL